MLKVSSPSDFKNKHRKKLFELPSGLVVEIQKVDPLQFMVKLGFLTQNDLTGIDTMNDAQRQKIIGLMDENLAKFKDDKGKQLEALEHMVTAGVSRPKVTNKPIHEVAEDEVHVTDFGGDLDALVEEISDFSGFKEWGNLEVTP